MAGNHTAIESSPEVSVAGTKKTLSTLETQPTIGTVSNNGSQPIVGREFSQSTTDLPTTSTGTVTGQLCCATSKLQLSLALLVARRGHCATTDVFGRFTGGCMATQSGVNLEDYVDTPTHSMKLHALYNVVRSGHSSLIDLLFKRNYVGLYEQIPIALTRAVECGYYDKIRCLHCNAHRLHRTMRLTGDVVWYNQNAFTCAFKNGDMKAASLLGKYGAVGRRNLLLPASFGGNVQILQLLYDSRPNDFATRIAHDRRMHDNYYPSNIESMMPSALETTAITGHHDAFMWLVDKFYRQISPLLPPEIWLKRLFSHSIKGGNLGIVRWIREHLPDKERWQRHNVSDEHVLSAIKHCHLDVAMYLVDFSPSKMDWIIPRHEEVINKIIDKGRLDILRWFYTHFGFSLPHRILTKAAMHNHLPIIKWVWENYEEFCTLNRISIALQEAARAGHLDVVEWLCPKCSNANVGIAMCIAVSRNQLHIVRWLYENRRAEANSESKSDSDESILPPLNWNEYLTATERLRHRASLSDIAQAYDQQEIVRWLITVGL